MLLQVLQSVAYISATAIVVKYNIQPSHLTVPITF